MASLSTHSPKRFWKFCFTRYCMVGETAATSSLIFCLKSTVVVGFFRTSFSWDILRGRGIATRDTRSDEYWSADEISSESRQNRCFWKSSPQQKPDALQNIAPWQMKCFKSIARRSLKNKFSTPTVPLTAVLQNRQVFLPDPIEETNHFLWEWNC